jgi:Flp pilus assembly protein TadG
MSVWRNKKGAVMVEFIIAFMPIITIFLVLVEVSRYSMAKMAMEHAAGVSARACSVIQTPQNQGIDKVDGDPATDVQKAGQTALNVWTGNNKIGSKNAVLLSNVKVTCDPPAGPTGTDEAKVEADYHCRVPLAGRLVCGFSKKTTIKTMARMGHQGAKYKLQ